MSKRPGPDQPTTTKRARKASGFRLARTGLTDSVQSMSMSESGSSRFVTLGENLGKRGGSLRAQNRLFHRTSESSKNQSDAAERDPSLDLQDTARCSEELEVQPDSSHTEHIEKGKRKRKRHIKTYVSDYSYVFMSS
jgi:hypothetical protein